MRSFLTRLLVAAVAIPALVFIFHRGGEWLRILVAMLILLGIVEAQRLSHKAGASYPLLPSIVLALLVPWASAGLWQGFSWPAWLSVIIIVAAIPVIRGVELRALAAGIGAQIVTILWVAIGLGALLG